MAACHICGLVPDARCEQCLGLCHRAGPGLVVGLSPLPAMPDQSPAAGFTAGGAVTARAAGCVLLADDADADTAGGDCA